LLKITYIAAVGGAAFIAWGIVSLGHESPRGDLLPPGLHKRLDDAFHDTIPSIPILSTQPRVVQTVKISPDPIETVEKIEPPVEKPLKKMIQPRSDICSVHRMRKVYISRYKWRCMK
jgi:hypothetical protein